MSSKQKGITIYLREDYMKKNTKGKIRRLINLEEKDGLKKTIERLQKRFKYLKSKNHWSKGPSNQMKYVMFHMRKYQQMWKEGIR